MAEARHIDFSQFDPTNDPKADIKHMAGMIQQALDDVYSKILVGTTATVVIPGTPAVVGPPVVPATPAKTLTITSGVVTKVN